jgi:hypothetical protein
MAYNNVYRPPGRDPADMPHELQQREHEHQDILQEKLQRHEHEHQNAMFDRQEAVADPFSAQLALVAIVGAILLNGGAMLLELGHASPAKMAPFAGGVVAGCIPTLLAWTVLHKQQSSTARVARHLARLFWVVSIILFAIGGVLAGA